MVTPDDQIMAKIIQLIAQLNGNNVPIEEALLFGSYANGTAHEDSDIDLALVSSAFQGIRFLDRQKVYPFILNIDSRIEPHPFSPEDFYHNDPFASEIRETGRRITTPLIPLF